MTPVPPLGRVAPDDLVHERLKLHAVAQMAAWIGRRLLPPADGPLRAALFWDARQGGILAGAPIGGSADGRAIRVGLGFDPAAVVLLEGDGRALRDRLLLDGATLGDAWARLTTALDGAGLDTTGLTPPSAVPPASQDAPAGAPLRIEATHAAELGRWFALADTLLSEQAAAQGLASAPPCWSHHFDMAVVVPLGQEQSQVTVGYSPGDETIGEPYLYVLAWPMPADLPQLPEPPPPGHWQREGWTGLALPGSDLLVAPTAEQRLAVGRSFFDRGFDVARSLALSR